VIFGREKSSRNSIDRKSRDFVEVKDRKKKSRNENLEKKLEINLTKKICEVHPKKTREKKLEIFFLEIWVA
jgi:hypothetical protein